MKKITSLLVVGLILSSTQRVVAAPPANYNWELKWGDEFDGSSVNTTIWKVLNDTRPADKNKTYYRPENVSVGGGQLKLEVRQFAEPFCSTNSSRQEKCANFTGGYLDTNHSGSADYYKRNRYGYYEARARYDFEGPGFWANFWMYSVWQEPQRAELDNELVTNRQGYMTNHHYEENGAMRQASQWITTTNYRDWHTYGMLWLPNEPVKFYLDDVLVATSKATTNVSPAMDMWVSVRAGAYYSDYWGGLPTSASKWPGVAYFDFVRAYQLVGTQPVRPSATPQPTTTPTPATPKPSSTSGGAPVSSGGVSMTGAVADARVDANSGRYNYGKYRFLHTDTTPEKYSYLKFDWGEVSKEKIRKVYLVLRVAREKYAESTSEQFVGRVKGDWDEYKITFENRPAIVEPKVSFAGAGKGEEVVVELPQAYWLEGSGNLSLALGSKGGDSQYFYAKESGEGPKLRVELSDGSKVVINQVTSRTWIDWVKSWWPLGK